MLYDLRQKYYTICLIKKNHLLRVFSLAAASIPGAVRPLLKWTTIFKFTGLESTKLSLAEKLK
jgi:hypothetical protein